MGWWAGLAGLTSIWSIAAIIMVFVVLVESIPLGAPVKGFCDTEEDMDNYVCVLAVGQVRRAVGEYVCVWWRWGRCVVQCVRRVQRVHPVLRV